MYAGFQNYLFQLETCPYMRNIFTQVATNRSHGYVNRGGQGHVKFNDSSRRHPHRERQGQCLSHPTYPRRDERQKGRYLTSSDVEGSIIYLRDRVTSDFAARSGKDRGVEAADEQRHSNSNHFVLAPSCLHMNWLDDENTSGSYREARQSFADREGVWSSADSSFSEQE